MTENRPFHGTKLLLFLGPRVVTILRDDRPDIPWPAHWDFPGGGREGRESSEACVLRETHEELGLRLDTSDLIWSRRYERSDAGTSVFFAAHLAPSLASEIVLGAEGQIWRLVRPAAYLAHRRANLISKRAWRITSASRDADRYAAWGRAAEAPLRMAARSPALVSACRIAARISPFDTSV